MSLGYRASLEYCRQLLIIGRKYSPQCSAMSSSLNRWYAGGMINI